MMNMENSPAEIKMGRYLHYKDKTKEYELIGIARHSESLEELVIYRGLYNSDDFGDQPMWARPVAMFLGTVTVEGKEIPRFEYIGN